MSPRRLVPLSLLLVLTVSLTACSTSNTTSKPAAERSPDAAADPSAASAEPSAPAPSGINAEPRSSAPSGASSAPAAPVAGRGVHTYLVELDRSALPDTAEEIAATLADLPESIGGLDRSDLDGQEAHYGQREPSAGSAPAIHIVTAPLSEAGSADSVMSEFFAAFVRGGGFTLEHSSVDPSGLMYAVGAETDSNEHFVTWADPDGEHLYAVIAPTPQLREAGLRAFLGL